MTNLLDSVQQPLQEVLPLGVTLLSACSGEHGKQQKSHVMKIQVENVFGFFGFFKSRHHQDWCKFFCVKCAFYYKLLPTYCFHVCA